MNLCIDFYLLSFFLICLFKTKSKRNQSQVIRSFEYKSFFILSHTSNNCSFDILEKIISANHESYMFLYFKYVWELLIRQLLKIMYHQFDIYVLCRYINYQRQYRLNSEKRAINSNFGRSQMQKSKFFSSGSEERFFYFILFWVQNCDFQS